MNEYSEKTDPTLVDLTLLGNSAAFEELVNRHQKKALGTAYKVTSNIWSAEDAAQDAFVSAWTHLSALEDKSRFGAWVCAITKNHACRIVKRYAAAIEVSRRTRACRQLRKRRSGDSRGGRFTERSSARDR